MDSTPPCFFVNEEKKQYLLTLKADGTPLITANSGSTISLPSNAFGAWFLRTHFKDVAAEENARIWYTQNDPEKTLNINHLNNTHRSYQHLALIRMIFSNCGLWLDMGLGKTFISISFALWLFQNYNVKLFLVICSPTLFAEWEDQLAEHISSTQPVQSVIIHGPKRKQKLHELRITPPTMPTFLISSYDTVTSVITELSHLPIGSIFVDEAARIKNFTTARTKHFFHLRNALPNARRFLLSGTPSTKDIEGNYSLYEWLGTGFSGAPDYTTFCNRYVTSKLFMKCMTPEGAVVHVLSEGDGWPDKWLDRNGPTSGGTWRERGAKFDWKSGANTIRILHRYRRALGNRNLDDWHRVVQMHSYAVYKDEVLPELPPKVYMRRDLEMTPEIRKAYLDMMNTSALEIEGKQIDFSATSGAFVKLHQIANGFVKDDEGTVHYFNKNPKLDLFDELMEEVGENKLVIWSPYHPQMKQLCAHLKKRKRDYAIIHGELSPSERKKERTKFIDANGVQFCIANPAAAGEGLNLQVAFNEWFVANWWKPDTRAQAEDRCHRIGQQNSVNIIDSPMTGTIEVSILHGLKKKQNLERKILQTSDLLGVIR